MTYFRVLIIGQGGREHALAHRLANDNYVEQLYISKGNAGTLHLGKNVDLSNSDFKGIGQFCIEEKIDILVVGPEAPLVGGIYDYFKADESLSNIKVFGPSKLGAQLEGSKSFSKAFMIRHNVPTAGYKSFLQNEKEAALEYLAELPSPLVIKADGLAGGKGVIIAESHEIGRQAIEDIFAGQFNEAGNRIVIEEFMEGIEFSVFTITDGKTYKILPIAKDYKRIGIGDTGLNTGGMGAVSPPPFVTEEIMARVEQTIIQPTINGLIAENISYFGFIYFGLMLCSDGQIKVVEYNCRMGDPESQAVFPRIKNSLIKTIDAAFSGELKKTTIEIDDRSAVTTVLVSGGYPEDYQKGKPIHIPSEIPEDIIVFHSGTKFSNDLLVSDGGRVLSVTALDENWEVARDKSQKIAEKISFDGKYYRNDIGFDLTN